jgi:hypothetical protein
LRRRGGSSPSAGWPCRGWRAAAAAGAGASGPRCRVGLFTTWLGGAALVVGQPFHPVTG